MGATVVPDSPLVFRADDIARIEAMTSRLEALVDRMARETDLANERCPQCERFSSTYREQGVCPNCEAFEASR